MEHYPKITIGMTSFFARDTIERAISSALTQDYPNIELVIVDDCSGDDSVEVIRKAVEGHDHVHVIVHEKNTGFAGALNTIIRNATGEFIAIFDDDDVSDASRLSEQYQRIISYESKYNTDLVLCHVARIQTYENGLSRYEKTVGTREKIAPHGREFADRVLIGRIGKQKANIIGSCANCARMARTKIFRDFNGFDSTMRRAEDTDFSIRFALGGGHFVGIEKPLVHQTMTTGSEKTLDAEYIAEMSVLEKHKNYLSSIGWYDFAKEWMEVRYAHLRHEKARFFLLLFKLFCRHPIKVMKKIYWALPAAETRRVYKDWHRGLLKAENS